MRNLPIDTTVLDIVIAGDISPATAPDGTPKLDRSGRALFNVPLVVFPHGGHGEGLTVRVPVYPGDIPRMTPVVIEGFTASPWAFDGRSGVSFRADSVKPRPKS